MYSFKNSMVVLNVDCSILKSEPKPFIYFSLLTEYELTEVLEIVPNFNLLNRESLYFFDICLL